MNTFKYGDQKGYLWRLGDTSTRWSKQIPLNEALLDMLKESENEGLSSAEIYKKLYDGNYKQMDEPSKNSDVALLIDTIKSFGLVEKKNGKYLLTAEGQEFYKKLNFEEENLSAVINKSLFVFGMQWKDLVWLAKFIGIYVDDEGKYAPFVKLLNKLIDEGSVSKEWLTKWTLYRCDPDSDAAVSLLNNRDINKIKSFSEIVAEKPFKKDPTPFAEMVKSGDFNETLFRELINGSSKVPKILQLMVKPVIGLSLNDKWSMSQLNKKMDSVREFFLNLDYSDFCTMFYNDKKFLTASKEYLNINEYWLNGLSFLKKQNVGESEYIILDNVREFLCFLRDSKHIWSKNNMPVDGDILLNFILACSDEEMIEIVTSITKGTFAEAMFEARKNEEVLPFSETQTRDFFANSQVFMDNRSKWMEYKKENNLLEVGDPAIYEFFVNLLIFYKLQGLSNGNANISFRELANTQLDSFGLPIGAATGYQPDGEFEYEGQTYIIETTLIDGQTSLFHNELEPITRHLFEETYVNSANKKQLKGNLLFFAPKYYLNFLNDFFEIPKKSMYAFGQKFISANKPKDKIIQPNSLTNNFTVNPYFVYGYEKLTDLSLEPCDLLNREKTIEKLVSPDSLNELAFELGVEVN